MISLLLDSGSPHPAYANTLGGRCLLPLPNVLSQPPTTQCKKEVLILPVIVKQWENVVRCC